MIRLEAFAMCSSEKELINDFTYNDKRSYVPVSLPIVSQFPPIPSIFDNLIIDKWWQGYSFQY